MVGYSYVRPGGDPQIGDLYTLGTGVAQRLWTNRGRAVLRGPGYRDGTRQVSGRGAVALRHLYP